MQKTPKDELNKRVRALQARMEPEQIDGALIVHNVNLFYFGGTVQQAYLFIPVSGEPIFFVRKNPERVKRESTLDNIVPVRGPRDLPGLLADYGYPQLNRLGMELDVLPVNQYFRYLKALKPKEIVDIWPAIQAVRTIKSEYEIGLIREAASLADYMVETARNTLREGITEIELAATVEAAARAKGHQGLIRMRTFNQENYWGHLVSGPEACEPAFINSLTGGLGLSTALPSGAGRRSISRHEPVVFDLCACLNGYIIDRTRTLCLGSLPDKLKKAYEVTMEIEQALEKMVRPGVTAGELYLEAERIAESHGLGEYFMGRGDQHVGFCGHGVGLEVDEQPVITKRSETALAPGMVIAIEPKFGFPDAGIVGVEDTFVVTETGSEKLTFASYDVEIDQE